MRVTHYKQDDDGNWVVMTPEEVEKDRLEGARERTERVLSKGHDCDDSPQYYEFHEDGRRYHGWECRICGDLIHTG